MYGEAIRPQPKPAPKLLAKRKAKASVETTDRTERQKCHARSGGQCEVYETSPVMRGVAMRCERRARQNHHLIGGIGRRNRGRSILAAHRLDTCDRCHEDITGNVLVPVDGTKKEHAATVRYERIR